MASPLIELRRVSREFNVGDEPVQALRDVDLSVEAGEVLAIVGPSGSGKSTMMNVMGLLDTPTSGDYLFGGLSTRSLSGSERADLRNGVIGFVFQQFHLLPDLSAAQNAELPLLYRGDAPAAAARAARDALAAVGMGHRMGHRPAQLSGGEKQRVAIARAIVGRPRVVFADEPTGALDSTTGARVLEVLLGVARDSGSALVMITHDPGIAGRLPRRIAMSDGRIVAPAEAA
jgi:putative ABC transport system ATP-binding protein